MSCYTCLQDQASTTPLRPLFRPNVARRGQHSLQDHRKQLKQTKYVSNRAHLLLSTSSNPQNPRVPTSAPTYRTLQLQHLTSTRLDATRASQSLSHRPAIAFKCCTRVTAFGTQHHSRGFLNASRISASGEPRPCGCTPIAPSPAATSRSIRCVHPP